MSDDGWEDEISTGDAGGDDDDEIKATVDSWSANSNEALNLEMHDGEGEVLQTFNPTFTYPIFGDEEAIFGYQDLDIQLSFASHDLEPRLHVNYGKKWDAVGDVKATDIEDVLSDFLPPAAFDKNPRKVHDAWKWTPPGKQIHSYTNDQVNYEIWCSSLSDPVARQLLENIQILVPLFIEGGSKLELDNDSTTKRWKLFLLYANYNNAAASAPTISPYELTGYATSYRVFTLPSRTNPSKDDLDLFLPTTQGLDDFLPAPNKDLPPNETLPTIHPSALQSPLDLPSRERLSQFLILPPHHRHGHGYQLYTTMLHHLTTSTPHTLEMSVEDPNEAFDDLRDMCDLHLLRQNPTFASLRTTTEIPAERLKASAIIPTDLIVPLAVRTALQQTSKIEQRQFDRVLESHLLSQIPAMHRSRSRITRKEKSSNEHDRAYWFWRLYVKQRLYLFNRDQLVNMETEERREKLEAAADGVEEGYVKLLERAEGLALRVGVEGQASGGDAGGSSGKGKRKRIVVVDEEDEDEDKDEDEAEDSGTANGNGLAKRVRS